MKYCNFQNGVMLTQVKNLTEEMIRDFREKANRTSIQTKLNSLLSVKEDMYMTLQQLYELETFFKKSGPLKYVFLYPKLLQFNLQILLPLYYYHCLWLQNK